TRVASEIAVSCSHWSSTTCEKWLATEYAQAPAMRATSSIGPISWISSALRMLCGRDVNRQLLDPIAEAAQRPYADARRLQLLPQPADVNLECVRPDIGFAGKDGVEQCLLADHL